MADPGDKKRRATYQDVLDAPENMVAEIVAGDLRLSPRPAAPHTLAASALGYALGPPFHHGDGGPGGWVILDEPELHLRDAQDPEIVVPDLAGWRRERFDLAWLNGPYFTAVPDWVCEVLSPGSKVSDRYEKLPIYAAAGVTHAWLLNPYYRTLEVFRLHDGKWLAIAIHVGNAVVRAEPFEAIELDLSRLFRDLLPHPPRASEAELYEQWAHML